MSVNVADLLKEIDKELKLFNNNFVIFVNDYREVHKQELKKDVKESTNESNESR